MGVSATLEEPNAVSEEDAQMIKVETSHEGSSIVSFPIVDLRI